MRQSRAPLRINFSGENRVTTFSVCVSFTVRKFLLRFNQVPTTSASSKVLIHTSSSSARVWLQLPAARSGLPSSLTEQKHSSGQLNLFLRHTSFLHVDYFKEILSRFLFFLSLSVAISPVISVQACESSSPDKWYLQPNLSAVSPADSSLSEISSIYFLALPYFQSPQQLRPINQDVRLHYPHDKNKSKCLFLHIVSCCSSPCGTRQGHSSP